MERVAMEKENKADGRTGREIVRLLAEVRSGGDAAEYEDEDALVGELEEVRGGVEARVASRRWRGGGVASRRYGANAEIRVLRIVDGVPSRCDSPRAAVGHARRSRTPSRATNRNAHESRTQVRGRVKDRLDKIDFMEKNKKWNVDNLSHTATDRTILSGKGSSKEDLVGGMMSGTKSNKGRARRPPVRESCCQCLCGFCGQA